MIFCFKNLGDLNHAIHLNAENDLPTLSSENMKNNQLQSSILQV